MIQQLDERLTRVGQQVDDLLRGVMYTEGFHDRKREWRRDRARRRATAAG
jgi:hypothetical protein